MTFSTVLSDMRKLYFSFITSFLTINLLNSTRKTVKKYDNIVLEKNCVLSKSNKELLKKYRLN